MKIIAIAEVSGADLRLYFEYAKKDLRAWKRPTWHFATRG